MSDVAVGQLLNRLVDERKLNYRDTGTRPALSPPAPLTKPLDAPYGLGSKPAFASLYLYPGQPGPGFNATSRVLIAGWTETGLGSDAYTVPGAPTPNVGMGPNGYTNAIVELGGSYP